MSAAEGLAHLVSITESLDRASITESVGGASKLLERIVPLRQWSGIACPPYPGSPNITEPLSGVGGVLIHFLFIFAEHINYAMAFTFLLLLLLAISRKKWLAIPALGLIYSIPYLEFASGDPWIVFLSPLLIATVMTIAAARF